MSTESGLPSRRPSYSDLQLKVQQYEDAISWGTTCLNCAQLMNANYMFYVHLERIKDALDFWDGRAEPTEEQIAGIREVVMDLKMVGDAAKAALKEAWQKGYTSGHSNAMRQMSDEPNAPTAPNPYDEGHESEVPPTG